VRELPTAIEIYKMLPKKNCGECKFPTCLAFAMQLANKKVSLEDCPYVEDSVKTTLEESGAPPIRRVKFGAPPEELEIGDETEMYRHEKKFYHPTVLALAIHDNADEQEQMRAIEQACSLSFERVGQNIRLDALALYNDSNDAGTMESLAKRAMEKSGLPIILFGDSPDAIKNAVKACESRRPLIGMASTSNLDGMAALAGEMKLPLCVTADNLEELAGLATRAKEKGLQDLVLDLTRDGLSSSWRT